MDRPLIQVTTTATIRPELIQRTFESFFNNLFGDWPVALICNIDPVGGTLAEREEVANICRKFFKKNTVIFPGRAHFGAAFHRCWSFLDSNLSLAFHLEDDWELLRPVDLSEMVRLLQADNQLDILRLPQNDAPTDGFYKDWNLRYPFNGEYFEVPQELNGTIGFCGHPSLVKMGFVQMGLSLLNPKGNPEKQLKAVTPRHRSWLFGTKLGVFSKPGESRAIKDIGREWRQQRGIEKDGQSAIFTVWKTA